MAMAESSSSSPSSSLSAYDEARADVDEAAMKELGAAWTDLERQALIDPLDVDVDAGADGDEQQASREQQQQQQQQRQQQQRHQTAYLDGLRGLAAFLVYMSHHIPWYYGINGPLDVGFGYHGSRLIGNLPFIRSLFRGGSAAVAIFFVLSGYVLSISPFRKLREAQPKPLFFRSLLSAVIRRPLRLFIPPAGFSIAFALWMHFPFGLAPKLGWPLPEANVFVELRKWFVEFCKMIDISRPHGIFEAWFPYNPPAWTLAIEFKGSLLVYGTLAVLSLNSARYRAWALFILGVFLLAVYDWAMACFAGGMFLAQLDLEGFDIAFFAKTLNLSGRAKSILHHCVFVGSWYLLCQPNGEKDPERSYGTWGWYYLTQLIPANYYRQEYWRFYGCIGAVCFTYSVLRLPWLQRFFLTRPLQYLGRISFSLYLLHIPFEWTIGDRIYRIFGVQRQAEITTIWDNWLPIAKADVGMTGLTLGFLVSQAVILPINILISEYATRWLDKPSVEAGRWVVQRLGLEKRRERPARLDRHEMTWGQGEEMPEMARARARDRSGSIPSRLVGGLKDVAAAVVAATYSRLLSGRAFVVSRVKTYRPSGG